jgi:hypothetical protein
VDLSFARLEKDVAVAAIPTELAVLLVGVAARQAASPTARAQAEIGLRGRVVSLLAPRSGAFHAEAAAMLTRWQRA